MFVTAQLAIDKIEVTISVDWRTGKNHKQSVIELDDKTILLNHTDQCIVDGDLVTEFARMPRLEEHYYHLFSEMDSTSNLQQSRSIHHVLTEVYKQL